jgi:hypothetical protein
MGAVGCLSPLAPTGEGLTYEARAMLITLETYAIVCLYVGLTMGWMRFLDRCRGW